MKFSVFVSQSLIYSWFSSFLQHVSIQFFFKSGSDGVCTVFDLTGQQQDNNASAFVPLCDVMFPNDLCENPAVQMHYSSTCCRAAGVLANKSCHVMLIVSQNSASMCQHAQLENYAIFSELPSNYVFIIILCFHNLLLICILFLVLFSLAVFGPGKL